MSLDVYLMGPPMQVECVCKECFHSHTREKREEYYSSNITHNLNKMADAAGIYKYLWHPEEVEVTTGRQLIEPLEEGLKRMKADPPRYRAFNASNGWGTYEQFIPFIRDYLEACRKFPEASVGVSR
jgi:hypothetical protein